MKFEIYDPKKTYTTLAGTIMDVAEVVKQYPMALRYPYVIGTSNDGTTFEAFDSLAALRTRAKIDPLLSDDDAVTILQDMHDNPPLPPEPEISPEERIAMSMEYRDIMTFLDESIAELETEPDGIDISEIAPMMVTIPLTGTSPLDALRAERKEIMRKRQEFLMGN